MSWSVSRPGDDHVKQRVNYGNNKSVYSVYCRYLLYIYIQYLHKNVLHNLVAVIVHTDVTGEGLAEENVSVWCREKSDLYATQKALNC